MFDAKKIQSDEISIETVRRLRADMARYTGTDGNLRQEIAHAVPECPTCGNRDRRPLFQKGPFSYHRCDTCGLAYLDPRLSDDELAYLYGQGRGRFTTEFVYIPTAETRKETIYRRKLGEVERLSEGRRLLDFGSSAGYFVQLASESGWDADGLEINPFCVAWAREELGLKTIHEGDLSECGFEDGQFDVITMWDVLEHIPDPLPVLQAMRPLLTDSGIIVFETSHFDCFETDFLQVENTNLTPDFHLMHFTRSSIEHLAARAGLKVMEQSSFGLDVAHILRYFRIEKNVSADMPVELVNALQVEIDNSGRGCYLRAVLNRK